MAKITIEVGVVESIGNGVITVTEEYSRQDGSKAKNYYKVWSRDAVAKGDVLHIQGIHSVKPSVDFQTGEERKWTDRQGKEHTSFEVHVNNPVIKKVSASKDEMPF